jgi:uncharacterized protein
MSVDHIRYDILAQDALRGVVRRVLTDAAKKGMPGEHHFFISFATRAAGVRISERLRAQYPEEMTVVLQHQFWDLAVTDQAFEVGLSFNGVPERLLVPFDAIKSFFDPSVQFGLQFDTSGEAKSVSGEAQSPAPADTVRKPAKSPSALPHSARRPPVAGNEQTAALEKSEPAAKAEGAEGAADAPKPPSSGGAEVVRLDRFRKK